MSVGVRVVHVVRVAVRGGVLVPFACPSRRRHQLAPAAATTRPHRAAQQMCKRPRRESPALFTPLQERRSRQARSNPGRTPVLQDAGDAAGGPAKGSRVYIPPRCIRGLTARAADALSTASRFKALIPAGQPRRGPASNVFPRNLNRRNRPADVPAGGRQRATVEALLRPAAAGNGREHRG
jgi:hypothetical protein